MTDGRGARLEVVVVGAGPACVIAALCAADLGARTVLVTQGEFGGMANDGPAPVRPSARRASPPRPPRQLSGPESRTLTRHTRLPFEQMGEW